MGWNCLVKAFSVALQRPERELIDMIGHDGSMVLWPELPEPQCRRGFAIDELIAVCDQLGYAVTPFQLRPEHQPTKDSCPINPLDDSVNRAYRIITSSRGVITGVRPDGVGHAVDYYKGYYPSVDFIPQIVWRIDAIQL